MKKSLDVSSLKHPLLIIGAGGHAVAMLGLLSRCEGFNPVGLIDSFQHVGKLVQGLPILGSEDDLIRLSDKFNVKHFLVAIGDNFQRHAIAKRLQDRLPDVVLPILIDPSAVVSTDVQLAPGVVVMAQAYVGPGCVLEEGSLLNTKASLDHEGQLGAYASLAPGAITGGQVQIGARSFIGLGSRLAQKVRIGKDTVVGAGSLVLSDLPDDIVSYGLPAKAVRSRLPDEVYL